MNITYINHSGFLVELENCILLFDYYKGELANFDKNKKLYVFSSHSHQDHFNEAIFEIEKIHPDVTYILSDDIKDTKSKNTVFVGSDENISVGDLNITTLESSDIGVAFLINVEGKTIYHAGDLNWWHWDGEPEADNIFAENKFKEGLDKIKGQAIDLAFLVLDPRQGDYYYLGFDYFMRNTDTKLAFPMHMWDDFSICIKFKNSKYVKDYYDKIVEIQKNNQSFNIIL